MADVTTVAQRMQAVNGSADPGGVSRQRRAELVDAFADAAGVPVVVDAVEQASRVRAAQATGWPVTKWLSKLRPDPLKPAAPRPRQERQGADRAGLGPRSRRPPPVQRARVDTAVRSVAEDVTTELPRPWSEAVRRASVSRFADLNDALDAAVTGTDLGVARTPIWWRLVRLLQWLLLLTALAGARVARRPRGARLPAAAGAGDTGLPGAAGAHADARSGECCWASCSRWPAASSVRWTARSKARSVDRRLRAAIGDVAERLVLEPIDAELAAYRSTRDGLAVAARAG